MSFFGFDKWAKLVKVIVDNGGIFKSYYKLWRMDTLKEGRLVGCDYFGNKYYENNFYMVPRNRWVDYNINTRWNYDATQITPEWYGWIHHKTDRLPCEDSAKLCIQCCSAYHSWLLPHQEIASATDRAYYPYKTTNPHICVWDGLFVGARPCIPE